MKTIQIGTRLTEPVVEALDVLSAEYEAKVREIDPGYELGRAGAVRLVVALWLRENGYLDSGSGSEADLEADLEQRQVALPGVESESKSDALRAALVAGEYETQKELAERFGVDPARVSRLKKRLKAEGVIE